MKLEKTESIIDPENSLGAMNSVISVLSSAFKISDTPLNYSEITLKNQFKSMGEFIGMIVSSYTMQSIKQFYKVLGSTDLIGNPVGQIDKIV